jgi:hypothetical protein
LLPTDSPISNTPLSDQRRFNKRYRSGLNLSMSKGDREGHLAATSEALNYVIMHRESNGSQLGVG